MFAELSSELRLFAKYIRTLEGWALIILRIQIARSDAIDRYIYHSMASMVFAVGVDFLVGTGLVEVTEARQDVIVRRYLAIRHSMRSRTTPVCMPGGLRSPLLSHGVDDLRRARMACGLDRLRRPGRRWQLPYLRLEAQQKSALDSVDDIPARS